MDTIQEMGSLSCPERILYTDLLAQLQNEKVG